MSILLGSGTSDPAQMFFGNNPLKEVWVGNNKIWPTGPQSGAGYWFDFDDSAAPLKNRGTTKQSLAVSGVFPIHDHDHVIFEPTSRLTTTPPTSWLNGYTVSMWTRDTPANSGWKTFLHRAPSTGWVKETYVVLETTATTTSVVSGLRFPPTHKEYRANYSFPVSSDWTHIVVVWERTSSTTFQCRFYINGVSRGVFNGSGYLAGDQFTSENLFIGGSRDAGEWSGRLDDFLLWDRGLSAAEVTELYNMGRSRIARILTEGPFDFAINESGSMTFVADFAVAEWSATGLPNGLTMGANGTLSGAATTEGSGTMVVTATGAGLSATKSFGWTATAVPRLPSHAITAPGKGKTSHSGWARPGVSWQLVTAGSGAFSTAGDLVVPRGKGRIRFIGTLTTAKNSRIVSYTRGVLATGSGTNQNYRTEEYVFHKDETFYIETDGYTGNTNDYFLLSTDNT